MLRVNGCPCRTQRAYLNRLSNKHIHSDSRKKSFQEKRTETKRPSVAGLLAFPERIMEVFSFFLSLRSVSCVVYSCTVVQLYSFTLYTKHLFPLSLQVKLLFHFSGVQTIVCSWRMQIIDTP